MKLHITVEQYEALREDVQKKICEYAKWSHGNSIVWMHEFVKNVSVGLLVCILKKENVEMLVCVLRSFEGSMNCGIVTDYCLFDDLLIAVEQHVME